MKSDLVKSFPDNYTPTPQQHDTLNKISRFIKSGKKYLLLSAPTGTGKSFLCKAICNATKKPTKKYVELTQSYEIYRKNYTGAYHHERVLNQMTPFGALILTITKNLQDQYLNFFPDIAVYKGKANYMCDVDPNFDVETAPCVLAHNLKDECWEKDVCPYYKARNDSYTSKVSTLNYRKYFTIPPEFRKREVVVCDEASELEEELVSMFSTTIKYSDLDRHHINYSKLRTLSYTKTRDWINQLLFELVQEVDRISTAKKKNILTKKQQGQWKYLMRLSDNLSLIESNWSNTEFVIDKTSSSVTFLPLRVNALAKHLYDYGDKIVLMSATMIDPKQFASNLGITDYDFIEVGSEFDPDKSPIYVSDKNCINYKNKHQILPEIAKGVSKIINYHEDDKGIIHTHSQEITNYIQSNVNTNRLLCRDVKDNNEVILKRHITIKKPTILVSPSLKFGVDLKDDLSRFQIIAKTPYPPLNNKRVARLFKEDKQWYFNKTLSTLVQMCGRSTRSADDHSVTYILDGSAAKLLKNCKDSLPKHFIDRIQ